MPHVSPAAAIESTHSPHCTSVILAGSVPHPVTDVGRGVVFDEGKRVANFTVAFSPEGIGFEVHVLIEAFRQTHRDGDIWRGDCLQIGIDPGLTRTPGRIGSDVLLLGFTQVDFRPYAHAWQRNDGKPTGPADIPFEFTRLPQGQTYRGLIPWSMLSPLTRERSHSLGFTLSVNSHRGDEPVYHTWSGGMINAHDASAFGLVVLDRYGLGVGAEVIHRGVDPAYDAAENLLLDLFVPVVDPGVEAIDLQVDLPDRHLLPLGRHAVRVGQNRLSISIPVAMLDEGENEVEVSAFAGACNTTILNRVFRIRRESPEASVARVLCEHVDWSRPELTGGPIEKAWLAGRAEEAALALVRHLRSREKPHMGFTRGFVDQLRAHATPAFRAKARSEIGSLLGGGFLGGSYPDGRGTLLFVRPEVLQVAALREDFERFARILTSSRHGWNAAATHTSVAVLRYIQAAWPLEECPDSALVPVLAFLAVTLSAQWIGARTWNEASHGTAHNWWAYEWSGNWKAGLLFPELAGFAKFAVFFPEAFEREARLLFFPDGFTREISTAYHIGTVDTFYEVVRLARVNGLSLSPAFHERLRAAAEVEWKLMQPDGNYPAFGDCFNEGPHVLERARSLAAIAGIPESKFLAETLDAGRESPFGPMLIDGLNYVAIGEDLRPAYDSLPARAPATLDCALETSGYYVMRQDWSARADYAAIEASPRGTIITSHGHSAIFDLKLCAKGRPILIANGKGPDDHGTPPRLWRVSAASHSCPTVDGEEPVPLKSIYRFSREVTPTVLDWVTEPGYAYFQGAHEGYDRGHNPVRSTQRKLFYLRGKYWILLDRFITGVADAPHAYRQIFQVGVPSRLEANGRCVTLDPGGNLLFAPVPGADGEARLIPCAFPLEGYPSPDQLSYTQRCTGNGLMATLLVPFLDEAMPRVSARLIDVEADGRTLSNREATALEIEFEGERHVYLEIHAHWNLPWRCGGFSGTTRLFHSSVMQG